MQEVSSSIIDTQSALDRYNGLKSKSQRDYYLNIGKTVGAVVLGLGVTALMGLCSAKLITGRTITTQFVGLASLAITAPIGLGTPITLGIIVGCRRDWTKYHKSEVAQRKCEQLVHVKLKDLHNIKFDKYAKYGIIPKNDKGIFAHDTCESFIKTNYISEYNRLKKIIDTVSKLNPDTVSSIKKAGRLEANIPYSQEIKDCMQTINQLKALKTRWHNFQTTTLPRHLPFPAAAPAV